MYYVRCSFFLVLLFYLKCLLIMTLFLSSSTDEDDNALGVPSSPSSPSITGFDGDNQSATSDDVADKAHGHRWLKAES